MIPQRRLWRKFGRAHAPAFADLLLSHDCVVQAIRVCIGYIMALGNRKELRMSIRSTITSQFEQVAVEQKRRLARLSDDLKLLDSGLDSLSFALIVMRLEEALGFDPFDVADEVKFPVTFGDFVKLYENHPQ
jgi:acyl carrier protein